MNRCYFQRTRPSAVSSPVTRLILLFVLAGGLGAFSAMARPKDPAEKETPTKPTSPCEAQKLVQKAKAEHAAAEAAKARLMTERAIDAREQLTDNRSLEDATTLAASIKRVEDLESAATEQTARAATAGKDAAADLTSQLSNLHFGLGLGVTELRHADVLDTTVEGDQKTVRVTDTEHTKKGAWLDFHYMIEDWNLFGNDKIRPGAFVAVQLASTGSSPALNAYATGMMLVFKKTPVCDTTNKDSFNVGLGVSNNKIQRLGNGISEDAPLPAGAQQVRFRKYSSYGVTLMISFNVL